VPERLRLMDSRVQECMLEPKLPIPPMET